MEEQPTCGKGLAENSAVPAKVAELIAALAGSLEVHMKALDLEDASSRKEFDAIKRWPPNMGRSRTGWRRRPGRWPAIASCPWAGTTRR
jgi:hypothetical protein